ncbi:Nitrogen regulation protein NR(II) [uncultured Clostridium sp.]|uniref:sensor histidine kinase n=1 Tax=uncultured Clostridium sp. TaxID=59620 RepID=UPI000822FEF0|nr:ATP-binding protein [uncultured Clostridium sp.]SCI75743.1 Nitrogen regulation protein NR(II) [uncultured Clostridium sp.]
MIINVIDIINSIVQCIMIIRTINYCLKDEYKKNNKELILYIIITCLGVIVSYKLVGNSSLNVLITHCISLMIPYLLFKKDILGIIVGHTIIYCAIAFNSLIFSNIFFVVNNLINKPEYIQSLQIMLIYLPQFIMAFIILQNLNFVNKIYKVIRSKDLSVISFLILSLILDFIGSFSIIIHGENNPIFLNIIFFLLSSFLVAITIYFANSEKKTNEIHSLNVTLEEKIVELKKVKHDYGSQISYLYALHLMGKYDRLGELLKDIIDGHNSISDQIQVSNRSDSVISTIVNSVSTKDINILIDEQVEIEEFQFEESELQRIISNILRNSVTAMNGRGIITIRTVYDINKVIMKIENNGPMIDKDIIDQIFEAGFSTKNDSEGNHGYGLAIVKEIIEKKLGKIEVYSDDSKTEFKIIMPLKEKSFV